MILNKVTHKQDKPHRERRVISDPIAHVVMDVDADLEQNQQSGVESMHVPLTS